MAIEIERKYRVIDNSFIHLAEKATIITQGYLSTDPERTVRVRKTDGLCTITIKGKSSADGLSRYEYEKPIPSEDVNDLLELCDGLIRKVRYNVRQSRQGEFKTDLIWEVDVFTDINLTIAEVELDDVNESPDLPDWIGDEVTGLIEYYNSSLLNQVREKNK